MKKVLLLPVLACAVLLTSMHAEARQVTEGEYQTAMVVSVRKLSPSNYGGDNPTDAPLQARDYSYDIAIRLHCTIYVGRYESAIRYLPSALVPNHEVDVRLHKHIVHVSLPFSDEEIMMRIVAHRRVKDEVCAETARKALAGQKPNYLLAPPKFKGGLV